MSASELETQINRFKVNEERLNTFVNVDGFYTTSSGVQVPTLLNVSKRIQASVENVSLAEQSASLEITRQTDLVIAASTSAQEEFLNEDSKINTLAKNTIADWQTAITTITQTEGVPALAVSTANNETQQDINDSIGAKWYAKGGGYPVNYRVMLDNGDIVKSTIDGNTNNPNVDRTGWEKPQSSSVFDESGLSQQQVNGIKSISDLRTTNPSKKGAKVFLLSANLDQDEGGGDFIATQKSGLVDNGGTIIASANPLLFWVRINYAVATFEMFGAKGDDPSFDNDNPIHRCVNSVAEAKAGAKWYYTSEGISIPDEFKKLTGVSQNVTRIIKTTNNKKLVADGTLVDYTLYLEPAKVGDPNTYYKDFSGFEIRKNDSLFLAVGSYGLYTNRVALSLFSNIRVVKFETGIHSLDCWMTKWDRVTVHAGSVGWNIRTGTSNVMNACWVISPTDTAYIFANTLYSVIIGCGCDFAGTDGAPANSVISAQFSQLTIIGMGYEKSHLNNFLYSNGSRISLVNVRGLLNENKYSSGYASWIVGENSSTIVVDNGIFGLKYKKGDQPNVPNAVYLAGNSTFDDRGSDLFRTYTEANVTVGNGNLTFDVDGYKREIIKSTLNTSKTINSDRRFITNNGLSFSQDPDTITQNGSYHINAATPMGYMMLQHINHSQNSNYAFQFGAPAGAANCKDVKMRIKNAGVWSTPCTVRNTDNTTVDANGFIKAASPIVKLFSDHIETNNEVPDIVAFEKLGVGDYLIKNTEGFSTDGWYVELPQDANGNKLFAVVYKHTEEGNISVKTYKRKFDIETAAIVADLSNPVDIKEGRWIDIRLN